MSKKLETQPKIFRVVKLTVQPRDLTEPPSQLICFPEEAADFAKFVGKKVRVRSIIELIDQEKGD